ncbi:MAG: hypothetical protein EOO12_04690, partial [Chitinophagaceae bacterium]
MKQHRVSSMAVLCLALSSTIISCQKEDLTSPTATSTPGTGTIDTGTEPLAAGMTATNSLATTSTTTPNSAFSLPYYRTINWDGRSNGNFGLTEAKVDLGPTAYWKVTSASQSQTYNKMLQTTLLKNTLTAGSVMSKVDIPDAPTYSISYDMQFA